MVKCNRNDAGNPTDLTERTADLGTPFGPNQRSSFSEDSLGNIYVLGINGQVVLIAASVPEPATWALFLAGCLLVGGVCARRTLPARSDASCAAA